jgi:hypothetical protein
MVKRHFGCSSCAGTGVGFLGRVTPLTGACLACGVALEASGIGVQNAHL